MLLCQPGAIVIDLVCLSEEVEGLIGPGLTWPGPRTSLWPKRESLHPVRLADLFQQSDRSHNAGLGGIYIHFQLLIQVGSVVS